MSAALAIPERRAVSDVRVSLWRLRRHLDGRRAKFLLRIENRSHTALETLTYARAPGAAAQAGGAAGVTVPPLATLSVKLVIALPCRGFARAVTEVRSDGETLIFPEAERPRGRAWRVVCLGIAAALGAAAWLALLGGTPSVTALAAPRDVRASRPFAVAYTLARSNEAAYSVVSAHGFVAAAGTLAGEQGAFEVALPPAATPESYAVRIVARGRLRDAARSVQLIAEPDPRPSAVTAALRPPAPPVKRPQRPPFAVDALTLGNSAVAGGKPVIVYYRVASVAGTLRLIDQYGTVRAEALLDRRGNSILLAPFVDTDQDFRVVLHAARGNAQAEKSVALRVTKERSLDDLLATARRKNDGPIVLAAHTVAPGDPIEIGIVRYEPGLRVAVVDPSGQEVASSAVGTDQNEVTLTAPAIAGTTRYTVTATYTNGASEETVVRDLTIGASPSPAHDSPR